MKKNKNSKITKIIKSVTIIVTDFIIYLTPLKFHIHARPCSIRYVSSALCCAGYILTIENSYMFTSYLIS